MNRQSPRLLASAAVLGAAMVAQGPVGRPIAAPRVPIHTAAADLGVPYGIWAAAEGYKCSFHDGMTFVPYLGARYPHNQPLSWRTTSVRVGPAELLERGARPSPWHDEERYEYRFGSFTEAYDVRDDGLEQTFVIWQRPAAGDMVVTGRVTSHMNSPNVAAAHQALTFFDAAGAPIIGYGRAFAVAADGDRIPITTAHHNGEVRLTVPAAWMAEAALPVTVDPLLSRSQVGAWNGSDLRTVDIARDDDANQLLFVTRASASQFDDDVSAMITDANYTPLANIFSDVTSSWDSDGASCAYVGGADKWAIVFRRYFGGSPVRVSRLRAHVRQGGNLVWSTVAIALATPTGFNDLHPTVGGVEAIAMGSRALVAFQREDNSNTVGHWASTTSTDVMVVFLDVAPTNGSFGTPSTLAAGSADYERPALNRVAEGGQVFSWVCAFQGRSLFTTNVWDVRARRISSTGAISTSPWISALAAAGTEHLVGPRIEGSNGRYAIAFAANDVATTSANSSLVGRRIYVERVDWAHGWNAPTGGHPPVELETNTSRIFEVGGVAFDTEDESHWVVGYRTVSPAVDSARCVRVGYTGNVTEGPYVLYSNGNHTTTAVACVFDRDDDDFLCAYGVGRPSQSDPYYGHTLEYTPSPPQFRVGPACSNAVPVWIGNGQIGSEFNLINVIAAPPGAGHFLLVSLAVAQLPIVHPAVGFGCELLVDNGAGFLGTLPFQTGSGVTWEFPLPEWLPPTMLHFQDWVLDGATFESSERLTVSIVK